MNANKNGCAFGCMQVLVILFVVMIFVMWFAASFHFGG